MEAPGGNNPAGIVLQRTNRKGDWFSLLSRVPIAQLLTEKDGVLERGGAGLERILGLRHLVHGTGQSSVCVHANEKNDRALFSRHEHVEREQ